jgi:hypothetical protein
MVTIECMVFLRNPAQIDVKKGLGVHKFARVPTVGEYIHLSFTDEETEFYKVRQVIHTGWSDSHLAEIYVIDANDLVYDGAEKRPPE